MLGLIAGTSLRHSDMFRDFRPEPVDTPYGTVTLFATPAGRSPAVRLCQRHDCNGEFVPPHNVNYRGNLAALKAAGVTRLVIINSVGGLHPQLGPGTLLIPDDYFCPWNPVSFSERGPDCKFITPVLDAVLRGQLAQIARGVASIKQLVVGGVYVQTIGPRFETKAEVRHLATLGDVCGMTGASEATLAQELDIPAAIVTMVDNHCHGVTETPLTLESFKRAVEDNRATVEQLVRAIIATLG